MYILLNKQTNVIEDITVTTFPVTEDFEWVEDNKVSATDVKKLYNKQTKAITEPAPKPQRPSELSQTQLTAKIEDLEARLEVLDGGAIIGVAQPQPQPQFPWTIIAVCGAIIVGLLIGRLWKK